MIFVAFSFFFRLSFKFIFCKLWAILLWFGQFQFHLTFLFRNLYIFCGLECICRVKKHWFSVPGTVGDLTEGPGVGICRGLATWGGHMIRVTHFLSFEFHCNPTTRRWKTGRLSVKAEKTALCLPMKRRKRRKRRRPGIMGGGQTRLQAGNLRYAQTVNRARTETQRCLLHTWHQSLL